METDEELEARLRRACEAGRGEAAMPGRTAGAEGRAWLDGDVEGCRSRSA